LLMTDRKFSRRFFVPQTVNCSPPAQFLHI
jgi:hypothetical protein